MSGHHKASLACSPNLDPAIEEGEEVAEVGMGYQPILEDGEAYVRRRASASRRSSSVAGREAAAPPSLLRTTSLMNSSSAHVPCWTRLIGAPVQRRLGEIPT